METAFNSELEKNIEQKVNLIKGEFSPSEAEEILCHLIDKKINFHKVRDFSREIRFGINENSSSNRIEELQEVRERVSDIVKEAELRGKSMKIKANIEIELV
ncbi:hypothetical protein GCM10027429_10890 [Marivirga atlantica]|uniref:Uncharacterized protein n=1 Tax=Marivirga atlantica TaxID=1548457 RepID=A0A937DDY7_9BACT|nr:hypothetical protein [Marivirga atlantica]MBL0764702.1 hypothetical protein [Marivirga atlantica]